MSVDLSPLREVPRLLIEAELTPAQGRRFQPTGFPDLGAAAYVLPDDTPMLLVESAQSMANRLEATCWDASADDVPPELKGLSFVRVVSDGTPPRSITNSLVEAHRLNSPYILESNPAFLATLKQQFAVIETGAVDLRAAARTIFRYDANSVLHGVFLAKKELAGGRIRLQRLLSSFVEAEGVLPVESGGVKNDRVDPSGDAKAGFGNVPFHRTEYVADRITAYFNLDLAGLRATRIGTAQGTDGFCSGDRLLALLALYKVRALLNSGLRFRTACDLDVKEIRCTRPAGFQLPPLDQLKSALPAAIRACATEGLFASADDLTVKIDLTKLKKVKVDDDAGGSDDE